jgi:hypothetical protein
MIRSTVCGTVAGSISLAGALAGDKPSVQLWVFRGIQETDQQRW